MTVLALVAAAFLFPAEAGDVTELQAEDVETTVYFDYGSNTLGSAGLLLVREASETALAAGFTRASVMGHADRAGPADQNYQTGMERAEAVAVILIDAGFDADNVEVDSAGETEPAVFYEDERREPRNRRAVISFER
ncbi:MAG: OmpA family protein [Pseudomonadota bacterium]